MILQSIGNAIKWLFGMIFGDRFKIVYWVIAAATAQHTAWGAATTMQGLQSEGAVWWWAQGLAFAIGIDFLMVMVATKVRSGAISQKYRLWFLTIPVNWYIVTFAAVAILSSYFQLLYAWKHIDTLQTGAGVASEWVARLQGIINARVVIAPLALPLIATLYTIGGLGRGGEVARNRNASQSARNPVASHIEVGLPELAQPMRPQLLPGATQMRNEAGELQGYICPACKKELSISGWSRHKRSCPQYAAMVVSSNGHDEHIQ